MWQLQFFNAEKLELVILNYPFVTSKAGNASLGVKYTITCHNISLMFYLQNSEFSIFSILDVLFGFRMYLEYLMRIIGLNLIL